MVRRKASAARRRVRWLTGEEEQAWRAVASVMHKLGWALECQLEVLVLGGLPILEPIADYGPFVMNSREEINQAIEDYRAGRLGVNPADQLTPSNYA
jgi:hypothetical protein